MFDSETGILYNVRYGVPVFEYDAFPEKEMLEINGMGTKKLAQYGGRFLERIRELKSRHEK